MTNDNGWTRRQFNKAMRDAGWGHENGGPTDADYFYNPSAPGDVTQHFYPGRYRRGYGVMWMYFAKRRQLPPMGEVPF